MTREEERNAPAGAPRRTAAVQEAAAAQAGLSDESARSLAGESLTP